MNSLIIDATIKQLEMNSVNESNLTSVTSKYSKKPDSFWVKIASQIAKPDEDFIKLSLKLFIWWKRNTHEFQTIV